MHKLSVEDSPECCGDWEEWSSLRALENTTRALDAAQKRLGIAQVIEQPNANVVYYMSLYFKQVH